MGAPLRSPAGQAAGAPGADETSRFPRACARLPRSPECSDHRCEIAGAPSVPPPRLVARGTRSDPAAVQIQICDFLGIDHFVAKTHVHNRRGIDFQLDAAKRIELAEILRPDVQLLVDRYGFQPAKRWLENWS